MRVNEKRVLCYSTWWMRNEGENETANCRWMWKLLVSLTITTGAMRDAGRMMLITLLSTPLSWPQTQEASPPLQAGLLTRRDVLMSVSSAGCFKSPTESLTQHVADAIKAEGAQSVLSTLLLFRVLSCGDLIAWLGCVSCWLMALWSPGGKFRFTVELQQGVTTMEKHVL